MTTKNKISIGNTVIGDGRAFLIAEVAQAHDGSLGLAHAFIDAAAQAGADAIKFQTHIAADESTQDETFRVKFSRQDATRYDYWKRMEFSLEQWADLADHARDKNLTFLSSAFSLQSVELLKKIGMPAWKVASGEITSEAILSAMISANGPFLVSSGMSSWADIDALVAKLRNAKRDFALMQCTSRYPTELENVGLNVIDEMRKRYDVPAGISDHSGRTEPAMAAIARGADVLEMHITLDRMMFGPDVSASLTVEEFHQVARFRDALATMDAHPVNKDKMAADLAPMRKLFGRSLAPSHAFPAGTAIAVDMLTEKKPGTGIPAAQASGLIGRKLKRAVTPDRLLTWDDFEDV